MLVGAILWGGVMSIELWEQAVPGHGCGFAISQLGLSPDTFKLFVGELLSTPGAVQCLCCLEEIMWLGQARSQQDMCCRAHHCSGDNTSFNSIISCSWLFLSHKGYGMVTADASTPGAGPVACTRLADVTQSCWKGLPLNAQSWWTAGLLSCAQSVRRRTT